MRIPAPIERAASSAASRITNLSRRDLLRLGATAGAGLALGFRMEAAGAARRKAGLAPNAFLRIDPDDRVTIWAAKSEMGQGVRTALPMIVAEELGADWSRVSVVHATPGPQFRDMRTSGSGAVVDSWKALRQAGATAREMLVSAAAARWSVDRAACRAEAGSVIHVPTGRRLAFGALAEAASRLPVPKDPPLKDPKDFRLLGTRVVRVDGPRIVSGAAVYGLDARAPGMLRAALARCPVPGGKAVRWDAAAAKAMPGVRDVVAVSAGVAVLADDSWSALKARDALRVTWDEGPNKTLDSAALLRRLEEAMETAAKTTRQEGDLEKGLSSAARRLSAVYRTPFQAHATLEPMNCIADVRGGSCELWVSTQAPNQAQEEAARVLGIPTDAVRVNVTLLGGGFGRRLGNDYVREAVEVSRAVKRPVQVVWSREDDFRHDFFHPGGLNRLTAGLDGDGRPVAWRHEMAELHLTMFGAFNPNDPETYAQGPWGGYDTPYDFPALKIDYAVAESPVPTGAWRSVTYPPVVFARESFLDEVAHAGRQDPVRLRLSLLAKPGPLKIPGYTIDRGRLARVVSLAAEKAGWGTPLPPGRGRGIACNVYHGQTHLAHVAEVSVGNDGAVRVHRVVCAVDCGTPINLSGLEGQVESGVVWGLSAALHGEITWKDGRVQQESLTDFPVLRIEEMPAVETHVVPSTAHPTGLGEQPVPPVAPAVANAVFAATGKRIRTLPLLPATVRSA